MTGPKDLVSKTRAAIQGGSQSAQTDELTRRVESLEAEIKALRAELGAIAEMVEPDGRH